MITPRYDPLHGVVRGVRAGVLVVPAVGASTLAHGFAGGCVSVIAVLAALGLCWPGAVALLGAQRRMPALFAGVVGAQALTHVLLEAACPTHVSHEPSSMLAAHAAAGLLLAIVLGRADAGLWAAHRLVRAAARALRTCRALPRPAARPLPARAVPVVTAAARPRVLWQAALPVRRGPPVACSF